MNLRFKLYFKMFLIGLLTAACTETMKDRLQTADLVFVSAGASAFDGAIASATSDSITSYTHVGIIDCREDGIYVLEASSKKGVTETPLDVFKEREGNLSYYRVVSGEIDPEQVIENAKSFIGQPYDFLYLPDNESLYCSELHVALSVFRAEREAPGSGFRSERVFDILQVAGGFHNGDRMRLVVHHNAFVKIALVCLHLERGRP